MPSIGNQNETKPTDVISSSEEPEENGASSEDPATIPEVQENTESETEKVLDVADNTADIEESIDSKEEDSKSNEVKSPLSENDGEISTEVAEPDESEKATLKDSETNAGNEGESVRDASEFDDVNQSKDTDTDADKESKEVDDRKKADEGQ